MAVPAFATSVTLQVGSDLDLSQPKVTLFKFADLFMHSLSLGNNSLLTVTVSGQNLLG